MGKSYKKTPISGHCSNSGQKKWKVKEHRSERTTVKNY